MRRAGLAVLLLAIAAGHAQSGGVDSVNAASHSVTVAESQNGQTVDVHVGDDVVVTFVASGGTGYAWAMRPLTSPVVAAGKQESVALHPGLPGGPQQTMFHVGAVKAGTVTLRFNFSRPWMKSTPPDKTFVVTLRVR